MNCCSRAYAFVVVLELMLPQVEIKSNNEIFRAIDDAYSDRQQTVFAMQTNDPPNLALRRFAEYFINPTMSQANLLHGRRLVDVKFREGSSYESVRRNQILASMFKPGHPALKFSSGNLKTLHEVDDDDKLLFYLHRFIRRHYSAHRMYLCVKSHVSLSSLQVCLAIDFHNFLIFPYFQFVFQLKSFHSFVLPFLRLSLLIYFIELGHRKLSTHLEHKQIS